MLFTLIIRCPLPNAFQWKGKAEPLISRSGVPWAWHPRLESRLLLGASRRTRAVSCGELGGQRRARPAGAAAGSRGASIDDRRNRTAEHRAVSIRRRTYIGNVARGVTLPSCTRRSIIAVPCHRGHSLVCPVGTYTTLLDSEKTSELWPTVQTSRKRPERVERSARPCMR